MNLMRRMISGVAVLTAAAVLTSCSPDGSGTISGPSDSLDRKEVITQDPGVIPNCTVTAYNVFMEGVVQPFSVECEDMNEAIHTIIFEEYNSAGCMLSVRGKMEFPSSGHEYSYSATRKRCSAAGASMTICGGSLMRCRTFALPVATAIDVRGVREVSK